jgi:hypothetical protein
MYVYEGWKFLHWIKVQKIIWKGDMHVVIPIEFMTIVSPIITLNLN